MTTGHADTTVPADAGLDTWLLADPRLGRKAGVAAVATGDAHSKEWSALRKVGGQVLEDRVAAALRQALPDRLVDVLVGGYVQYDAVREGARASLADPTGSHDVDLADRTVHARHEVAIDVRLTPLETRLPFVVLVDFHVVHARAHLTDGKLAAIVLADPELTGTVTAYGTPIGSRSGTLRLGRTVELVPPVRVLSEREDPTG